MPGVALDGVLSSGVDDLTSYGDSTYGIISKCVVIDLIYRIESDDAITSIAGLLVTCDSFRPRALKFKYLDGEV